MEPTLWHGDCLERMKEIPDGTVDAVLCDLPYGRTRNRWDSVVPLEPLWAEYRRVCKKSAPIILTAIEPFTSLLVTGNLGEFRYDWIWEKTTPTGHLNAKRMPMRAHESVLIFCRAAPPYYPQKTSGHVRKTSTALHKRNSKMTENYGRHEARTYDSTERYPRSVQRFSTDRQKSKLHPTQKPVALMEYLIRTYTNEGELVLDNCAGSFTTGVACVNLGRRFIGIEKDEGYFRIGSERVRAALAAKEQG